MRTLAAGALALMLGGCLKADAVRCDNGAICKSDQACTESPVCTDTACQQLPLCGPPELVAQCMDDANAFVSCDFSSADNGTCVDRICTQCTPDLAGCGSTSWEAMTAPDGTPSLKSVWLFTRTHAIAGGGGGTLLEYDGRSWQRSESFPSTQGDLTRIWATGPDDVYVVSNATQVFHFDGTSWRNIVSDFPSGTGAINAIHGAAKNDVYAAGFGGTLIHFDGSTWSRLSAATGPTFYAVTETASGAIAVGANGYVMQYTKPTTPATFSQPLEMPFANAELSAAFLHDGKLLVGGPLVLNASEPTLLELDDVAMALTQGAWKVSPVASEIVQSSIFCAADDYACSDNGHIYRYDGATWQAIPAGPSPTSMRGISARDGYVFAVGDGAVIWRMRTN